MVLGQKRPFPKSGDQGRVASIQAGKGINPISKKGMFGGYCLVGMDAVTARDGQFWPILTGQSCCVRGICGGTFYHNDGGNFAQNNCHAFS
jgi:hypothetical protein